MTPRTDRVRAVPNVLGPCTVAVTVTTRSLPVAASLIEVGFTLKWITVGVRSSSLTVSSAEDTSTPARSPANVTMAFWRATWSLVGVTVTAVSADAAPGGMVMVNAVISSTLTPPEVRDALTDTVLASPNRPAPCTVAVTVTALGPSPSMIRFGLRLNAMAEGASSSSVMVMVVVGLAPGL